jgi:serine/threonine protein kinase
MPDVMSIESVFFAALEKGTPTERAAFLDTACADDHSLRQRVERLLVAHPLVGTFMGQPARFPGDTEAAERRFVDLYKTDWDVGPYRMLRLLGEGGMGVVYLAEQQHPVQRRVALKIIRPGLNSAQVVARFEAERQALALMDHPNIAKVFDVGATADGRPYFVMELVEGLPITTYCDAERLNVRERLALFVPVCQAIHHAHQKGIIHRDIKPFNVLIATYDGRPVPKVIDFGIAKALDAPVNAGGMETTIGQLIGTLEYMSPEQAEPHGRDIDTRSDVYALGVLLYELLAGSPPFDGQGSAASLDDVLHKIRHDEPTKPSLRIGLSSERLATIAAQRNAAPAGLTRLLRGELDWIVIKALEKDRERRFESAQGLARDVMNYLADEPVLAGPPSVTYRLHKFLRRHLVGVGIGAVVSAALAALFVNHLISSWQVQSERDAAHAAEASARAAEIRADRNFRKARQAVDDYLQKVANSPDLKNRGHLHELRKQLLAAAMPFLEEFAKESNDDPVVRRDQATALIQLANLRTEMGEWEAALVHYAACRDILDRLASEGLITAEDRSRLAACHSNMAAALIELGRRDGAAAEFAIALTQARQLADQFPAAPAYRMELANIQSLRGNLFHDLGQNALAEAEQRAAKELQEALVREQPEGINLCRDLANTNDNLGILLRESGRLADAEAVFRGDVPLRERIVAAAPRDPRYRRDLAHSYGLLALTLSDVRKSAEAARFHRLALAIQEKLVEEFPEVTAYASAAGRSHYYLGYLCKTLQQPDDAEAAFRVAIRLQTKLTGESTGLPQHCRDLGNSYNGLGNLLTEQGQKADAEAALRTALAIREKLVAACPDVPNYRSDLASGLNSLGILLSGLGQRDEAEETYRQAIKVRESLAADFPKRPQYRIDLAGSFVNCGNLLMRRHDELAALEWYAKAIDVLDAVLAPDARNALARQFLRNALWGRADALHQLRRPAEALADADRALTLADGLALTSLRVTRAILLMKTGKREQAIAAAEALLREKAPTAATQYGVACVFAQAAQPDAPTKEADATRAVALLRGLLKSGFFKDAGKIDTLNGDRDFDPLRERDDFRQFVLELEPTKPPGKP